MNAIQRFRSVRAHATSKFRSLPFKQLREAPPARPLAVSLADSASARTMARNPPLGSFWEQSWG
eukprot:5630084-Alexandrium_andersonii.AAC.1